MSTIGEALTKLELDTFLGRERELAAFQSWLDSGPSTILNVHGPGGVGKSTLLRAFRRAADQQGRPTLLIDGRHFRASTEGFLAELGETSLASALHRINQTRPLLLIDTFEEISNLTRFLLEAFLPNLDVGVRLVIAGRYSLGRFWDRERPWTSLIQPLQLGSFTRDEVRTYLTRLGIDDERTLEQVFKASGGHPLALSLAVDLSVRFGVQNLSASGEWRKTLRGLVEQFLLDTRDPRLRSLLEAASIVRQFDEDTLRSIAGNESVDAAFDQFCELTVVRGTDSGLMLHDDVRHILADDLRWRNPERHRALRGRALAHYQERTRTAVPSERERLLIDRLFLWEDSLIQALLFERNEPGEVWIDVAGPEDYSDVLRIWSQHLTNVFVPRLRSTCDPQDEVRRFRPLVEYPGLRLRIARDSDGRAVGFSAISPICQESLELLSTFGHTAPLINALRTRNEISRLPAKPEEAEAFVLISLIPSEWNPTAVHCALARDLLSVLALEGVYLCITPFPEYKQLLESLGFEKLPGTHTDYWGPETPNDGYILDLQRIGIEAWFEAITAGRKPKPKPTPSELESIIQEILRSWHDDANLGSLASRLKNGNIAAEYETVDPASIRRLALAAFERACAEASPQDALAYHALTLAYLQSGTSHERLAERLHVSRATYFRLLKRAIRGIAEAW